MRTSEKQYREAALLACMDNAHTFQVEAIIAIDWLPPHLRRELCAIVARRVRECRGHRDALDQYDEERFSEELNAPPSQLTPERRSFHRQWRAKRRRDYERIAAEELARYEQEQGQRNGGANHE
jgi:hypothetical protein